MAHRIEKRDTVALSVHPAWHGLGIVADHIMSVDEAFKLALQWKVAKQALYRQFNGDIPAAAAKLLKQLSAAIPEGLGVVLGRKTPVGMLTVREDVDFFDPTGDLGLVGPDYSVIQNEAVCEAAKAIVGGIDAQVETAGSLCNNKRGFLVARFPTDMNISDDICRPYILLSWSHDGTMSLEVKFTTIRVVCMNTLAAALADGNSVKIKHSKDAIDANGNVKSETIANARTELFAGGMSAPNSGIAKAATAYIDAQSAWLNRLANTPVTSDFVRDYFRTLIPVNLKSVNQTRRDGRRSDFESVWNGRMHGDELRSMHIDGDENKPTAFRLLQAVTFVTDHLDDGREVTDKKTGEKRSPAELRFNRITNIGQNLRDDATGILTEGLDSDGKSFRLSIERQKDEYERLVQRTVAKSAVLN